jgi:hypothetical protein
MVIAWHLPFGDVTSSGWREAETGITYTSGRSLAPSLAAKVLPS